MRLEAWPEPSLPIAPPAVSAQAQPVGQVQPTQPFVSILLGVPPPVARPAARSFLKAFP